MSSAQIFFCADVSFNITSILCKFNI